jgi:hypothetical protein
VEDQETAIAIKKFYSFRTKCSKIPLKHMMASNLFSPNQSGGVSSTGPECQQSLVCFSFVKRPPTFHFSVSDFDARMLRGFNGKCACRRFQNSFIREQSVKQVFVSVPRTFKFAASAQT